MAAATTIAAIATLVGTVGAAEHERRSGRRQAKSAKRATRAAARRQESLLAEQREEEETGRFEEAGRIRRRVLAAQRARPRRATLATGPAGVVGETTQGRKTLLGL